MSKKKKQRKELLERISHVANELNTAEEQAEFILENASPLELSRILCEMGVHSTYKSAIQKILSDYEKAPQFDPDTLDQIPSFEILTETWIDEIIATGRPEPEMKDSILLYKIAAIYYQQIILGFAGGLKVPLERFDTV